MVIDELVLEASNGRLRVTWDVATWAQITLEQGQNHKVLGAERLTLITNNLLRFLMLNEPGTKWVLSLAERHFSMYGEHANDGVQLKIQDATASWVTTLQLSPDDKKRWLTTLSSEARSRSSP